MKTNRLSCIAGLCLAAMLNGQAQTPPAITKHPTNLSLSLGATATFQVSVSSSETVGYQWYANRAPVPAATLRLLTITNVQLIHAGDYYVVATNLYGSATSQVARLSVDPTFVKVTGLAFLPTAPDMPTPFWVDYDRDGWLDVVVGRGYRTTLLPMEIYRNNRDGTFSAVTNKLSTTPGRWFGPLWADFDRDGDLDCFANEMQPRDPSLFLNLDQGEFSRIILNASTTVNGLTARGTTAAIADYDSDGWVDVAVGYYGSFGSGVTGTNVLLHNVGGGRFEVVTNTPIALRGAFVETFYWIDYDGDGDLDLFGSTSGDVVDQLFQNQGDGTFVRILSHPLVDTAGTDVLPSWADYDNDGDLDLFVPYFDPVPSVLYRNLGGGQFEVDSNGPQLQGSENPVGASWGDYDNDGNLDLFIAQNLGNNRLFRNQGDGTFTEVFPGSPVHEYGANSWYAYWVDYNNDGFLDLFVLQDGAANPHGFHGFYRNNLAQAGNSNNWLKVQLNGVGSSYEGIGAKVRVKATIRGKLVWQLRQVGSQPYGPELVMHFGLGDAAMIETLRIEWPSGIVQELKNVVANQFLTVTEPSRLRITGPDQFQIQCWKGMACTVEASSDLVNWVPIGTVTNETGTLTFPVVPSGSQQFYRTKTP